jgi:hypothetical protein
LDRKAGFAIKDGFSNDLEVPYEGNRLRFVINDALPWADEQGVTAHLDIISNRAASYLAIAKSDKFRLSYPKTSLDNVSIALRLRHAPTPSAETTLCEIVDKLAEQGVRFFYGSGGANF